MQRKILKEDAARRSRIKRESSDGCNIDDSTAGGGRGARGKGDEGVIKASPAAGEKEGGRGGSDLGRTGGQHVKG